VHIEVRKQAWNPLGKHRLSYAWWTVEEPRSLLRAPDPGPRRNGAPPYVPSSHHPFSVRPRQPDQISVELVEPADILAVVRIVWPQKPTMVDPKRFPDVAALVAQLFARAHIVLASMKAQGR
jgi:hypothetical protein